MADYILGNCDSGDKYSPYVQTVFKVINYYKENPTQGSYEKIYKYLKLLNPQVLSSEKKKFQSKKGKTIEGPSDKEQWYSSYTKACMNLNNYEECIKYSKEAIRVLRYTLKDKELIWYENRIGKSLRLPGRLEEAEKLFKAIDSLSDLFYIKSELAELYMEYDDKEKAMRYYLEALLSKSGELKSKIKIIEAAGDFLYDQGKYENAKLNYNLAKAIRSEENWPDSRELERKLERVKDIPVDLKNIRHRCIDMWSEEYSHYLPSQEGVISRMINDNCGFISYDSMDIYFFRKSINDKINGDILHRKVRFNIIDSFDKKKNKNSKQAVNIRFI